MQIHNVRCYALAVVLMCIALGCGGSSPTAPTPTAPPAPVVPETYIYTAIAERTSLKLGETTTITLKAVYSPSGKVVSYPTCNPQSGTVVSWDANCTVTAMGPGTLSWCWWLGDETPEHKSCITFTVAPIATTVAAYATTGGPNGITYPYDYTINRTGYAWSSASTYNYFGGYEGHLKNTGDGCAKNISWVFYIYDVSSGSSSLVEYDAGSLSSSLRLSPGTVTEFEGCCLTKTANRLVDGIPIGNFQGHMILDWDDVACP